jgi:prepilin-type N-terminal cleavage/methylation domain-containing protein
MSCTDDCREEERPKAAFSTPLEGQSMSQPARDGGFTLIEVLVAISLMSVMMFIAISGWSSWARASEQAGTARELQSVMRRTQQSAVTEGRAMCVQIDVAANQYSVYRGACADASRTKIWGPMSADSSQVAFTAPDFPGPGTGTGVTFYARGTASSGSVKITRAGATRVYTVSVEGLTGRVSLA